MKLWQMALIFAFATAAAFAVVIRERLGMEEDDEEHPVSGKASFYGDAYRGKRMANGERFYPDAMTCAAWKWPLGSWLEVEHRGRRIVVQVTDRGPAVSLNRMVDLSEAAFARLADLRLGVITVNIRQIPNPAGGAK